MDLLGRLFILSPIKETMKFTNVFTRNMFEFSNVLTKETSEKYCCRHCGTYEKKQINLISV